MSGAFPVWHPGSELPPTHEVRFLDDDGWASVQLSDDLLIVLRDDNDPDGRVHTACWTVDETITFRRYTRGDGASWSSDEVAWWMPLPPIPKESQVNAGFEV